MTKSLEQVRQELEQTPQPRLNEASLERVYEERRSSNVGFITAHRSDYSAEENLSRSRQLQSDIRSSGFGFRYIDGHFIENHGTPDARKAVERAYMVIGRKGDDSGNMMGFLKKYGAKYDQDCVIYKSHDEASVDLVGTTHRADVKPAFGEKVSLGRFHPDRAGEYHAALRRQNALVFDSGGLVEMIGQGFFGGSARYLHAQAIYKAQFTDGDGAS
ncbi:hypothetical protein PQR72_05075 [Paraburkholderia madseniana]|uniref:hypothetical protein n=1 Tax=Paraburkholderia madseniana TaxID=2599607 RepID=UPI0015C5738E|nr:hypothetical protein [Paraburkholderia madseniana]